MAQGVATKYSSGCSSALLCQQAANFWSGSCLFSVATRCSVPETESGLAEQLLDGHTEGPLGQVRRGFVPE